LAGKNGESGAVGGADERYSKKWAVRVAIPLMEKIDTIDVM